MRVYASFFAANGDLSRLKQEYWGMDTLTPHPGIRTHVYSKEYSVCEKIKALQSYSSSIIYLKIQIMFLHNNSFAMHIISEWVGLNNVGLPESDVQNLTAALIFIVRVFYFFEAWLYNLNKICRIFLSYKQIVNKQIKCSLLFKNWCSCS